MQGLPQHERGAALVTVLLFMVLTFILITTMLTTSQNAIIISGLHRDGVRALELAQAGAQEAIRRIEAGRPNRPNFNNSISPGNRVDVTRRFVGTGAAYEEINSKATVGRGVRTVNVLVLQVANVFPPNITYANTVGQGGNTSIDSGDAYARTYIDYKKGPAPGLTYAGWWVHKNPPGSINACYTHAQCVANGAPTWWPGTRRGEPQLSIPGSDIAAQTLKCPAGGGGLLPSDTVTGVKQDDPNQTTQTIAAYGFDTDGGNAITPVTPCGLPFKYVAENVQGTTVLFKTVVYDQWFGIYYRFDDRELKMVKTTTLANNPQYGAVPPFPTVSLDPADYDLVQSGGGTISGGNLGCKYPEMSCVPPESQPLTVLLNGDWHFAGQSAGHGLMVVNGNLDLTGQFTYYGTIIVTGDVHGAGLANITGGLIAKGGLDGQGNFSVHGGVNVTQAPTGPSQVFVKAWRER